MPNYVLRCDGCGREIEITCTYSAIVNKTCGDCKGKFRVQFKRFNFRIRHGRPDVIQWKKEKGALDEIP